MISPYVTCHDLMPFIDGRKLSPPQTLITPSEESTDNTVIETPNLEYDLWVKQDQLIFSILLSTISPELIHLVVDCSTSKQVWDSLKAVFILVFNVLIRSWKILALLHIFKRPRVLHMS